MVFSTITVHISGSGDSDLSKMAEVFVGELQAAGYDVKRGELVRDGRRSNLMHNVPRVAMEIRETDEGNTLTRRIHYYPATSI